MQATLYIIGTGPGDPEQLTLKAMKALNTCSVLVTPKGSVNGNSTALAIVSQAVDTSAKEILELYFPMKKIHIGAEPEAEVRDAWQHAARTVLARMEQGKDVAFPTLGDPAVYSTGYYLYENIMAINPAATVKFISGITAMSSCSAATAIPVCLGDEMLAVIPATFKDNRLRKILEMFDTIVLMKVHKVIPHLCQLLGELGLLDKSVLVERAGMDDERVFTDLTAITAPPHYFSTIIIRKKQ
ncbi:MAG: precorrin-2 C(20)-methyltransferase [Desulfocapsaceae bacterium]|nr:precorrin-2 C(20)-methyltransferase [Desulfocapsaceae bacterium]